MHVLVLGLMAVYTLVLLLLVSRNVHALRTHHACADVSAPLARTLAAMLDAPKQRGAAVEALRAAPLRAVRVAVFGTNGEVILDTHEGGEGGAPTEEQKEARAAARRAKTARQKKNKAEKAAAAAASEAERADYPHAQLRENVEFVMNGLEAATQAARNPAGSNIQDGRLLAASRGG